MRHLSIPCLTRTEVQVQLSLLRQPTARYWPTVPVYHGGYQMGRRIISHSKPQIVGEPGRWSIEVDVALEPGYLLVDRALPDVRS